MVTWKPSSKAFQRPSCTTRSRRLKTTSSRSPTHRCSMVSRPRRSRCLRCAGSSTPPNPCSSCTTSRPRSPCRHASPFSGLTDPESLLSSNCSLARWRQTKAVRCGNTLTWSLATSRRRSARVSPHRPSLDKTPLKIHALTSSDR